MATHNNNRKYLIPTSSSLSSSSAVNNHNESEKGNVVTNQNTNLTLYDLKLSSLQEPTTPIDKLNTPRTVTVKTATFFPPSPPINQNNDTELNLTGKLCCVQIFGIIF